MSVTNINRPLLRYHGGKYILSDWILSFFPKHRIYVEPFGGAASVLLKKKRSEIECYNDINSKVVAVFRVMQDSRLRKKLKEKLKWTPYSRTEWEMSQETTEDIVEQARRVIVRSWMSHGSTQANTGFRTNLRAAGVNPPRNWKDWKEHIEAFAERLEGVIIENTFAEKVMEGFDTHETLFYVDPPYIPATRGRWANGAYEYEMSTGDHEELIRQLNSLKGMVVLSGYNCDLLDDLLRGWERFDRQAYADKAHLRTESVWLNQAASDQQKQLKLF